MRGMFTVDWRDAWRSLRGRADGDDVRGALAGARHRRRHGALLDPQQPRAQAAAGARPAAARAARPTTRGPIRSGKPSATGSRRSPTTRSPGRRPLQPVVDRRGRHGRGPLGQRQHVRRARRPGRRSAARSRRRTTCAAAAPDGPVAVISYAHVAAPLRRRRRRRSAGTVSIERVPFTIVGVTPKGFFGPDVGRSFDVAIPLGTEPLSAASDSALDERSTWWMNIMARLKPGQTPEQATALLARDPAADPRGDDAGDQARGMREQLPDRSVHALAAPGGRSSLRARYEQPLTRSSSSSGSCCSSPAPTSPTC